MKRVTVCIQAYNHEKYIAECIESILQQKTDFDYELLIGEDDSKDNTRKLCLEYRDKYPDKIRLLLNSRENVIYIDDKPTGRFNFLNNLENAKGEYIAICDGDDYWIDSKKLQKQVDFLDANKDCVACFGNAKVVNELNGKSHSFVKKETLEQTYGQKDLLNGANFIPTCTLLFRNQLDISQFSKKVPFGDYYLNLLLSGIGGIHYFPDFFGVYRINETGIHGKLTVSDESLIAAYKQHIKFWQIIKGEKHFDEKPVNENIENFREKVILHAIKVGKAGEFMQQNNFILKKNPRTFLGNYLRFLKNFLIGK